MECTLRTGTGLAGSMNNFTESDRVTLDRTMPDPWLNPEPRLPPLDSLEARSRPGRGPGLRTSVRWCGEGWVMVQVSRCTG